MSAPQTRNAAQAAVSQRTTGITARPPRILLASQGHVEAEHGPTDPLRERQILHAGGCTRVPTPAIVVYQLVTGDHQQTGVVVEVALADYRDGRIRRHEGTQPERERELHEFTEIAGIEQMPVILTHADRVRLRAILAGITSSEPAVHRDTADGTTHTVWVQHDADLTDALHQEIGHIDTLYIADGHHRMAAAERYASRRSHLGGEHASAFTLAALFPTNEMRILGYHRCLPLPAGISPHDVLQRLAALSVIARIENCASPAEMPQPAPGILLVRLESRWYRLWLRPPEQDVRTSLDVVVLDDEVLPPILDLIDPGRRTGLTAVPKGNTGNVCWCAARESLCFLPQPPSIEQVMAVSDAGLVMPPKSTWFAPKASAALFIRELP